MLVGKLIVTVTFTKSRWVKQRSYVYDSGELDSPWPNSEQGGWSATDNAVTITYPSEWRAHTNTKARMHYLRLGAVAVRPRPDRSGTRPGPPPAPRSVPGAPLRARTLTRATGWDQVRQGDSGSEIEI